MKNCIVIADDDSTVLQLVSLRLGMGPYTVASTGDAQGALAMIRSRDPVAAILDVQMPGGGSLPEGLAALAAIKADPALGNLPVMMLTGERNTETVMQAMENGADDYMVKPFDPDTLMDRVSRMISRAALRDMAAVGAAPGAAAPVWEL
jgi:DNA-binding response OmpR family regulator